MTSWSAANVGFHSQRLEFRTCGERVLSAHRTKNRLTFRLLECLGNVRFSEGQLQRWKRAQIASVMDFEREILFLPGQGSKPHWIGSKSCRTSHREIHGWGGRNPCRPMKPINFSH